MPSIRLCLFALVVTACTGGTTAPAPDAGDGAAGSGGQPEAEAGSGGDGGRRDEAGSGGIAGREEPAAGSGGSRPDAGAYGGDEGETRIVGVGSFGLRGLSKDGESWSYCGSPELQDDHTPDLLRAVSYGDGVFVAVGGNENGLVMRSLDGEHWDEDVHPLDACPDEDYPSSCRNWMGAVVYHDGVWLAGGGNGATMRSEDAGLTWRGLHKGFPEKHIRSLGAGGGRFIAGTDGGGLYVTADRGESWKAQSPWSNAPSYASLRIAFGRGAFIAFSEEGDACFVSVDLGESWQPCAAEARGGSDYICDDVARVWIAAQSGAYALSADALLWRKVPAPMMPRRLLNGGDGVYYGRTGGTVYRAHAIDGYETVATNVPDFRAWTAGRVRPENLAITSPAACVDRR